MSKTVEAFGKYILLERLAAGGMAEIYLSKSQGADGIGKFVAIKRILPQYSDNQDFIDMFKAEAKTVMNLNHGNIVSIYDFGTEKGQFFLVMEFVEGQNLRQILNQLKRITKYFSIDQIVYIIKEVASGLDHAHRCIDAASGKQLNITHRDMSPQNVMISFEGEVKVVDFGIAKSETQLEQTRAGTIKGKFGYMSPEQAEGQIVDARTDIFSLGTVLWELLAQDRLFIAQSEAATLRKVKECQIPSVRKINPNIHPDLERIVLKALVRDRSLRYQTMEMLSKDLNRFLNTHYPDFNKQEFSRFMKTIYNEMFLENRKKLSEYAKIERPPEPKPEAKNMDRTTVMDTNSFTEADGKKGSGQENSTNNGSISTEDVNSSPLFEAIANSNVKTDLGALVIDKNKPVENQRRLAPNTKNVWQKGTAVRDLSSMTGIREGTVNTTTQSRPEQVKKSGSFAQIGIAAVVLIFGSWMWLGKNPQACNQMTIIRDILPSMCPPPPRPIASVDPKKDDPESMATVPFSVTSTPSGAKVYVDDELKGETPLRTHIEKDRTFRVRLIANGYLPSDFPGERASADGYTKKFTMMPEPQSGMIIIDANNLEPNAILLINGQRQSQSISEPVKIPAGTSVMIRVINPGQKLEGSETVIVGAGQTRRVRIQINRSAQIQF